MEPQTFNPDTKKRAGIAVFALGGLGLLSMTFAMLWWDPPRSGPNWTVFWFSLVLWGSMTAGCVWLALVTRMSVSVDAIGLTKTAGRSSERIRWEDISELHCSGSDGTAWKIQTQDSKTFALDVGFLKNREALKKILQEKRAATINPMLGTFRVQGYAGLLTFLIAIGVAFFGVAFWTAHTDDPRFHRPGGPDDSLMFVALGLLLLLITLFGGSLRYEVKSDRIIKKSLLGMREVFFRYIEKIELDSHAATSKRSAAEVMRVTGGGKSIFISSNISDYAEIRETILAKSPSAQIIDRRKMMV